jgi:hypothetical protein
MKLTRVSTFATMPASWLMAIVSCAMLSEAGCENSSGRYWFHYSDKAFSGSKETCYELYSGNSSRGYKVAPIYLKFSDGRVAKLSDLTEDTVREWIAQKSEVLRDRSVSRYTDLKGLAVTNYDVDGVSRFVFHDGKLVGCGINGSMTHGPFVGLQVGPGVDGEFISFPISREDLSRVFGEPERIVKSSAEAR